MPPDAGITSPGVLTIEKILEEKHVFDLSRNFEKTKLDDTDKGWSLPGNAFPFSTHRQSLMINDGNSSIYSNCRDEL